MDVVASMLEDDAEVRLSAAEALDRLIKAVETPLAEPLVVASTSSIKSDAVAVEDKENLHNGQKILPKATLQTGLSVRK